MDVILPTRAQMIDSGGRYLTQSLFLETNYRSEAIYSLKAEDWEFEGKLYPSLKKLYLAMDDPSEYEFATKYLAGWRHWQRMNSNRILSKHFEEWREELEYKLRSKGMKAIMEAMKGGSYQAAKFFADKGWDKKEKGRPSKEEIGREMEFQKRVNSDYGADIVRLFNE